MRLKTAFAVAVLTATAAAALPANATGIARIEKRSGTVRTYDVAINVIDHSAVRITSADRHGTLVVGKAACTYAGDLERCLPYHLVLDQDGVQHPIDIERGSEYLNRTNSDLALPYSSRRVPAHGILLFVRTVHGTYITISGTVDGIRG